MTKYYSEEDASKYACQTLRKQFIGLNHPNILAAGDGIGPYDDAYVIKNYPFEWKLFMEGWKLNNNKPLQPSLEGVDVEKMGDDYGNKSKLPSCDYDCDTIAKSFKDGANAIISIAAPIIEGLKEESLWSIVKEERAWQEEQINQLTAPNEKWQRLNALILMAKEKVELEGKPDVSGSLPSVDPLDDENSEIHKIGREIAEMSDVEFEANCKAIEKMLKGSKGNDH